MTDNPQVLLFANNNSASLQILETLLPQQNYRLCRRHRIDKVQRDLRTAGFDVLITAARPHGLELLQWTQTLKVPTAVILLVDYADSQLMQHCQEAGAFACLTQPFRMNELLLKLTQAVAHTRAMTCNEQQKSRLAEATHYGCLVGDSDCMQRIYTLIAKVGPLSDTVLIRGESGTGKELVAKALHQSSNRHDKAFVVINCAALPEPLLESELFGHVKGAFTGASQTKTGLFESADGGTLFLDEVGSIPLSIQSKLLRVLQDRQVRPVGGTQNKTVDVRIIAATNEPLENRIQRQEFRQDLYYRLSVIPLEIPPLRNRSSDISLLVEHILQQFQRREGRQVGIQARTLLLLQKHSWPGNVRELENVINRAAALCDAQTIDDADVRSQLSSDNGGGGSLSSALESFHLHEGLSLKAFTRAKEREFIAYVLNKCDGNKEHAAKVLGISPTTLYRKYTGSDG